MRPTPARTPPGPRSPRSPSPPPSSPARRRGGGRPRGTPCSRGRGPPQRCPSWWPMESPRPGRPWRRRTRSRGCKRWTVGRCSRWRGEGSGCSEWPGSAPSRGCPCRSDSLWRRPRPRPPRRCPPRCRSRCQPRLRRAGRPSGASPVRRPAPPRRPPSLCRSCPS